MKNILFLSGNFELFLFYGCFVCLFCFFIILFCERNNNNKNNGHFYRLIDNLMENISQIII